VEADTADLNPYRDVGDGGGQTEVESDDIAPTQRGTPRESAGGDASSIQTNGASGDGAAAVTAYDAPLAPAFEGASPPPSVGGNAAVQGGFPRPPNAHHNGRPQGSGRHGRRNRGRGPRRDHAPSQPHGQPQHPTAPALPIVADTEVAGWFDSARDAGYIRRATASYLADPADPFVPAPLVRQLAIRRGDALLAMAGRDGRGRLTVAEVMQINGADPTLALRRPDFSALTASYPDRKLTLETGRSAKGGPELTRRAIDLIAPIGYGQRALIVAPARAGKTMLLQAITEGVAINHPDAALIVLLVDERPEEVSEMITWGYGEVVASSFDMPAERHTDVAEMVLERARRLVEGGQDVVIVLDSITRLARAHNTVERGTGRTLSGGLDATAMAKPKAFFGSARAVAPNAGGGSLTIIATALVETGSRMDDVIFEEFKGTGNCEIKLDRGLAEKRIFPAIDIATSGTRREEKLFAPQQLEGVYTLRRGLQQMPPQSAMEWLIKRIAATPSNDLLLSGL
jgi:transcription termination factor Rho